MHFNKPKSGGNSTEFGAGDFDSAAMGPRRTVGVHGRCLITIVSDFVDFVFTMETGCSSTLNQPIELSSEISRRKINKKTFWHRRELT